MDHARLELLVGQAVLLDVLELGGAVEGALIVLEEDGNYPSPNYRWFGQRNAAFAYVDRIMLSSAARGAGWGVKLYQGAVDAARDLDKPVLTAEVNTVPANPRSIRFHEAFGFSEVGRERPYGPDEEVAMFELRL